MQTVTLLDGGMGQELVRRSGKEPSPLWSAQVMLETPELVEQLHIDFIQAGAAVITVNAYSATEQRLVKQNQSDLFDALQTAACRVANSARAAAGVANVQIAGCLPPLVASYRADLTPSREEAIAAYQRIVEAQSDSVDFFMCETMASVAEAEYALTAASKSGKPVWVALTLDDGQPAALRSGEPWQDAADRVQEQGAAAILLNCSRPETIDEIWSDFALSCDVPIGAYANGFTSIADLQPGGTVSSLEARHDLGPEAYARFAMEWVKQGATLIGGCCEVGPDHIAQLARELAAYKG